LIRKALKAGAEKGLLWTGVGSVARSQHRSRTLVLAYHNVVPDGSRFRGDSSLHLPRARFAAHLDALTRTHDVVPLEEIFVEPPAGSRPRAVVTFDDAYRGAVTIGVDELVRRGLPATIFVAPAFLGGASFWWDCLADSLVGEIPPALREHALAGLRGEDAAVRAWAVANGVTLREPPLFAVAATENELAAAGRQPGITVGSHTWSHPNLAEFDPNELPEQLERPLAWLRAHFENVVPWLSYPYGRSSPAVEHAARDAGYRGALMVDGGWIATRQPTPFALPRYNVPAGLSMDGFRLRAAGLFCR
jgi:peptidoglycan/xylan/chitin deacetylase (PgdA/CDA1 family)